MRTVHIAEPADADRADAEAFIQDIYGREYGARIAQFAPRILCRTGPEGDLRCVAGLRLPDDGFFSEGYLDEPVEAALTRAAGRRVRRDDVFEVTTLASRSPREIAAFVDDIIAFGADHGLSWCFFTLTRRLSLLIQRLHLAPIPLADADPARIADAAAWGRYYATEPKVFGVCGVTMRHPLAPVRTVSHAAVSQAVVSHAVVP
ncbi:thermostable hemolysin [Xanthobacter agilis]|jgi:hypothetical protein|uniref:Thermostable hemolysin n=1 Tax=Xanthobacter agilis TaxID=47492 RepID=A0ABU0LDV9_XANAG|nr:thermostable hemolysin [Xanthobacter agilis]MDQ0505332.1 hypothetical protein [Xanthobacter agilis]